MKLIVEIQNKENIKKYQADGLIFSFKQFATYTTRTYDENEISDMVNYCIKHQILPILKIDKIIEQKEVKPLIQFLKRMIILPIAYFMFTDFAILDFFQAQNQCDRLIYVAKTLNTNRYDCAFYQKLGIHVMLSHELHIDDVRHIVSLGNIVLDGYGYSPIFYAKRKLLSLFNKKRQIQEDYTNHAFSIKEETRDERYPIYENNHGTFIFTTHKYVVYQELPLLEKLAMFKVESMLIDEEALLEICQIYYRAIHNKINEEDYQRLLQIDSDVDSSFLYKKNLVLGDKTNE